MLTQATYGPPQWIQEVVPGCPTQPFVSNEPVCGRAGQCPRPCRSTLFGPFEIRVDYEYDADGNIISVKGPRTETRCTYAKGRVVECSDHNGTQQLQRDPSGRITGMSIAKDTWTFTYNAAGDLATIVVPPMRDEPGGTWTLQYDDQRRLVAETAGLVRVTYKYDDTGRMIERSAGGDPNRMLDTTTFRYDDNDRLLATTSTLGFQTSFKYDAQGRFIEYSAAEARGAQAPSGARVEYDCR